jgi:hypothetical protein
MMVVVYVYIWPIVDIYYYWYNYYALFHLKNCICSS